MILGILDVDQFEIRVPRGTHGPSIFQPCLVHVVQILTVGHAEYVVLLIAVAGIVCATRRVLAKEPVAGGKFRATFAGSPSKSERGCHTNCRHKRDTARRMMPW